MVMVLDYCSIFLLAASFFPKMSMGMTQRLLVRLYRPRSLCRWPSMQGKKSGITFDLELESADHGLESLVVKVL